MREAPAFVPRFLVTAFSSAALIVVASSGCVVAPLAAQVAAAAPPATSIVIRAARLIDGTGSAAISDAAVVVTGDRIVAVGKASSVAVPAGARVIDLGDATLLPGFIDAHTHIIGRPLGDPASDLASVKDFPGYAAIVGVENARRTLMAGFTSIRVVGAPNFDDMALREAITNGTVPGPRMENAGHAFGITGGHCDENGWTPGLEDNDYRTALRTSSTPSATPVR